ncbi:hypothetical protein Aperf_G00000101884 [Anoplocephala perfoliata]
MSAAVEEQPVILFRKVSENATIPTRGSDLAAGYDLYSAGDYVVKAGGRTLIDTGIQIALPPGCYGRVSSRSGLCLKHGIQVGGGVIDQDYRGNIMSTLFNFGEEDFVVKKGDRYAQLICERIFTPTWVQTEDLGETNRGANGYGSTGLSSTSPTDQMH